MAGAESEPVPATIQALSSIHVLGSSGDATDVPRSEFDKEFHGICKELEEALASVRAELKRISSSAGRKDDPLTDGVEEEDRCPADLMGWVRQYILTVLRHGTCVVFPVEETDEFARRYHQYMIKLVYFIAPSDASSVQDVYKRGFFIYVGAGKHEQQIVGLQYGHEDGAFFDLWGVQGTTCPFFGMADAYKTASSYTFLESAAALIGAGRGGAGSAISGYRVQPDPLTASLRRSTDEHIRLCGLIKFIGPACPKHTEVHLVIPPLGLE